MPLNNPHVALPVTNFSFLWPPAKCSMRALKFCHPRYSSLLPEPRKPGFCLAGELEVALLEVVVQMFLVFQEA